MGCLKRIAALTALATTAVMVAGVVNVPAALTLPSTDPVTTTLDTTTTQVTVPSTTTTVPSTPVSPTTTVTTPTVTTPKSPAKTITNTGSSTLDQAGSTVKKTTGTVTQSPTSSGSGGGGGGTGGGSTLTKQTSSTIDAVTGVASGETSDGTSGAKGALGTAGGGSLTGTAGGGGTAGSSTGLGAFGFFGGPGGPGGSAGGTGTSIFGGPAGGAGAGRGGLPPTLSAAGAKQLRLALEQLDGCMSAIAPIDRQVLGMRAGAGGAPPLSRSQVASRLGVSTRQVRLSERRGLSGLRAAAEQTGCAGSLGGPFAVSGIGDLTPMAFAAAPGAGFAAQGGGAGGDYVPARAAEAESGSPLKDLQGNGTSGPAWLVVLVTILFSVSIAALTRELRSSVGA